MPLLGKIKAKFKSSGEKSCDYTMSALPLGPESVIRYRQQRGVNLGAWFVNERWLATDPYANVQGLEANAFAGSSDHDIARSPNAKQVLEKQWDTWIGDEDWKWIVEHGFNSVRLPIGYYHLVSAVPDVIKGTDFGAFADVFQGAWGRIQRAVDKAGQYGLGVLIDLHCAAGGQNRDPHCGISTGKVELWNREENLKSTALALDFLAKHFANVQNVIGLELLNEPANDKRLPKWYQETISRIRASTPPDFPLYIHDAFVPWEYASLVGKQQTFVVLDHHLYRCFDDKDKDKTGEDHARNLNIDMAALSKTCNGSIVVGEWSVGLDSSRRRENDSEQHKRAFCRAQLDMFENFTAGWFFWTYKVHRWDYGGNRHQDSDPCWSAVTACAADIMPKWAGFKVKNSRVEGDGGQGHMLQAALDSHTNFWNKENKGKSMEHDRFQAGLQQGWADALMFINTQGPPGSGQRSTSKMGFVHQWCKRRLQEHEKQRGGGEWLWEYEHGFKQGVQLANEAWLV